MSLGHNALFSNDIDVIVIVAAVVVRLCLWCSFLALVLVPRLCSSCTCSIQLLRLYCLESFPHPTTIYLPSSDDPCFEFSSCFLFSTY